MTGWIQPVFPEGAPAVWGARAIATYGVVDIVQDRQSLIGEPAPRKQLLVHLNGGLLRRVGELAEDLLRDGTIRGDAWEDFILHVDDEVTVWANTLGSHGYLYLVAWLHPEHEYEFEVQGLYAGTWELVTTETTRGEAEQRLTEYRANEPATPFRVRRTKGEQ